MAPKKENKVVTFLCRTKGMVIIVSPSAKVFENGQNIVKPGKKLEFNFGKLELLEGRDDADIALVRGLIGKRNQYITEVDPEKEREAQLGKEAVLKERESKIMKAAEMLKAKEAELKAREEALDKKK